MKERLEVDWERERTTGNLGVLSIAFESYMDGMEKLSPLRLLGYLGSQLGRSVTTAQRGQVGTVGHHLYVG